MIGKHGVMTLGGMMTIAGMYLRCMTMVHGGVMQTGNQTIGSHGMWLELGAMHSGHRMVEKGQHLRVAKHLTL